MTVLAPAVWISCHELAAHVSCQPKTLYRAVRDGKIPSDCYMRVGAALRFDAERTLAHLKSIK